MSNVRAICRPNNVFSSIVCCCRDRARTSSRTVVIVSLRNSNRKPCLSSPCLFDSTGIPKVGLWSRFNHRRTLVRAANWEDNKSPYETLELDKNADDEKIKVAYRRLAKFYHPDVYDGRGTLEEGETAEARFIKIQAAYELLMDDDKRREYDTDNRVNPKKASQAWMDWLMKKRKAFEQRGDMAFAAWAEQQQLQMNLRVRQLSRSKVDPDEERKILAREKKASIENYNNTLRRHTLVLRKRDLMRQKAAEEEKKRIVSRLLAEEGLELATDDDDDDDDDVDNK